MLLLFLLLVLMSQVALKIEFARCLFSMLFASHTMDRVLSVVA